MKSELLQNKIDKVFESTSTVTDQQTAANMGSGDLPVFATPSLVAFVEGAAKQMIADCLEGDETTVGTRMDVNHTAATPVSMSVRCEVKLIEVDRKRVVFTFNVYDETGEIGNGTHERFVVSGEKFMQKTTAKLGERK